MCKTKPAINNVRIHSGQEQINKNDNNNKNVQMNFKKVQRLKS